MPVYCYKREDTGEIIERFFQTVPDEETRRRIVLEDGVVATRILRAERRSGRAMGELWPLHCWGSGIHPSQVSADGHYADAEMRRRFPDHRFDPKTGEAVYRSQAHRRRVLQDIGMKDLNAFYG